jgi:hypothetical protein
MVGWNEEREERGTKDVTLYRMKRNIRYGSECASFSLAVSVHPSLWQSGHTELARATRI